ncbi:MAG: hypothetical protein ACI8RD_011366 [Bacillariaceae sp.]|jgi:hypothetical protein
MEKVTASLSSTSIEPEPTEDETKITNLIAKDRPTIDAAVKSFISIICARTMSASNTDAKRGNNSNSTDNVMMGIIPATIMPKLSVVAESIISNADGTTTTTLALSSPTSTPTTKIASTTTQQQVLQFARFVIKAVNSYTFPIHDTVISTMAEKRPGMTEEKKKQLLEISVVARLWNGLVQSEQKPSRFLGRRSLKLAWENLNLDIVSSIQQSSGAVPVSNNVDEEKNATIVLERQLEWVKEFGKLLFNPEQPLPANILIDDDSALLWATDGGISELAKRRQRRLDSAKEREAITPS